MHKYKGFQIETIDCTKGSDALFWAEIIDLTTSCLCHESGTAYTKLQVVREAEQWCDRAHPSHRQ